jgi:hypothetical protein
MVVRDMKRSSAILVPRTFRTPYAMSMPPPRSIQPVYEDVSAMDYERRVEFDIRERDYRSSSPPERPRLRRETNKDSKDKERKENPPTTTKDRELRRETFKERVRGGQPPPSSVLVGYKYPSGVGSSSQLQQQQQLPKSILKQQRIAGEGYPSPPFAQPGIIILVL